MTKLSDNYHEDQKSQEGVEGSELLQTEFWIPLPLPSLNRRDVLRGVSHC